MKPDGKLEGREWSRRSARIDVGWIVLIECPAGKVRAQMLNVSARGFRLRSAKALEAGWKVSINFGKDAPVNATVQWVDGRNAGGIFVEAIAL